MDSLSTKKKGIVKSAVASTISQQPGPFKEAADIAKVGATGIAKKMVNSVPKPVANAAGAVMASGLNIGGTRDNNEKAKQYGDITKKLQRGRGIPDNVLYKPDVKDPAFRAKVMKMGAMDDYKRLQAKQ